MRKTNLLIVGLLVFSSLVYFTSCNNQESASKDRAKEDSVKAVVARGAYLANHVAACIHCHSKRDFSKFTGPVMEGSEGMGGQKFSNHEVADIPGTFYARNITPDQETGIGSWTDDEILRAITMGISKNGDTLFPLMPYVNFNHMAKDDLMAIIAYLRTLKPIKNQVPQRQLMIPISAAYPAPVLKPAVDENVRPAETDVVNYGSYLVNMADCGGCHTPFLEGAPDMSKSFAGGILFTLPNFKVVSANITPDSATGIGTWGEEAFLAKFEACRKKEGYDFDAGKSNTIMPVVDYSGMRDTDLKAIYAFLRSIKPVNNPIVKHPQ